MHRPITLSYGLTRERAYEGALYYLKTILIKE